MRRPASVGWLGLAAGIVIGLLLAWAASWVGFGSREEQDDWRRR